MTIRVRQMEEPLAPFGIARCRVRTVTGRDHARVEGINVGMVEDDTSPPRPTPLGRLGDQIEIAGSSPKARKCGVVATVNDLKSQYAIEADCARHVVGGERNGTDALDHRENTPLKGRSWLPYSVARRAKPGPLRDDPVLRIGRAQQSEASVRFGVLKL